jgi:hypothetical protein
MNPNPEREDPLLNAVLKDEFWQTTDAACKTEALAAFRARQRVRRLGRWTGCVVALAVAVVSGVFWFAHPVGVPVLPRMATKPSETPREPGKPRYLTDDELVASFPEGSCFLAEIDGQKKLVFLDPEIERRYVSRAGQPDTLAP